MARRVSPRGTIRWSSRTTATTVASRGTPRSTRATPAAGVTLVDLGVPRDATVVAVVRDDRLIVPRGDTRLAIGDEVLVLVTADAEDMVQQLLVGH